MDAIIKKIQIMKNNYVIININNFQKIFKDLSSIIFFTSKIKYEKQEYK